jgi:hypothetical protein
MAYAGPNANAAISAAVSKAGEMMDGEGMMGEEETITLAISATGLSGVTGYTAVAWFNTADFDNPTAANNLTGAVGAPALPPKTEANTDVEGFDTQATYGAAMLGTPAVDGDDGIATFTFTTKAGFTTGGIAVVWVALRAGAEIDTVFINSDRSAKIFVINPPAPEAMIDGAPTQDVSSHGATTLSASLTGAAGDTITWTVSAALTGAIGVTIDDITGDPVTTLPSLPLVLGATEVTFSTITLADGTSTITLGGNEIGSGTATIIIGAGGTVDTARVIFDVAFPAELSAFAGELKEGNVQLNWTAVSQTNNAGWRVLRSMDNENFEPVGDIVPGAGTSNEALDYGFSDTNLPEDVGKVYYVLEQVDLDGTVTRSGVAEVLLGGRFVDLPSEFSTMVYPNPFNPATTIAYSLPEAARVSIVVYDAIGQEIRSLARSSETAAGRYSIQWDARDNSGRRVASGVYFAHITAGNFKNVQKMMLLK